MKGFTPLMSISMERTLGKAIHLGTVFAEVSSPYGNQQGVDTF